MPPPASQSYVFCGFCIKKKKEENYFIAGSYFSAETDVPLLGRSTEHRPSKGLNEHHSLLNKKISEELHEVCILVLIKIYSCTKQSTGKNGTKYCYSTT